MRKATISGIVGSIMLCIMAIFFLHTTETVKLFVSVMAIAVFLCEGIILFAYAFCADD